MPVAAPSKPRAISHQPHVPKKQKPTKERPYRREKPKKKRKSLLWEFAEEAFDFIEDIFD
ncbi:hypothetical protein [Sulfitobacter donghicola]|nr:hypothetical protein [Sulfitobacter donghicola]